MPALKEITVFTNGSPEKLSTFSNVPFFFIKTLREKGIRVNTVNIEPIAQWGKLWNRYMLRLIRILIPGSTYSYDRTRINEWSMDMKIAKAVGNYPNAQANVFLTFIANGKKQSSLPSILVSDWSYEYVLRNFWDQEPDFLQKRAILRQNAILEGADHIFCLFPGSMREMRDQYKRPQIHYLGNFLNCFESPPRDILEKKKDSYKILFIGKSHYKEGAEILLKVFQKLKPLYPKYELDIIGMNKEDLGQIPEGVRVHGYLDKEKLEDRTMFYHLLENARVFINTNPKWGAFSSTLEALFFYTPIIISPYEEFILNFGREIPFGIFCPESNEEKLFSGIQEIMNASNYLELCQNAHETVKTFTWESVCKNLFTRIGFEIV